MKAMRLLLKSFLVAVSLLLPLVVGGLTVYLIEMKNQHKRFNGTPIY